MVGQASSAFRWATLVSTGLAPPPRFVVDPYNSLIGLTCRAGRHSECHERPLVPCVPAQVSRFHSEPVRARSHKLAVRWMAEEGGQIVGVDNVNNLYVGLHDRTCGLPRILDVFAASQCLQGLEDGSSPTWGTQTPRQRGFCFVGVCTKLCPVDSDGWFAALAWPPR